MLTLTENASTIVKTITLQTAGTEEAGLRISSPEADSTDLSVAVATAPEATDAVVESGGARIFVDENAAPVLDDKILDAEVDEAGAVRFAIGEQA